MGNKAGVRHYFAEGLTTRGYISLLPNMMVNWKRTYVLMGGPGTGKSTIIKVLGLEFLDRGYKVDFLRSARDPDSVTGFILPETGLGMLDVLEVSPLRWRAPGLVERFIDMSVFCDRNKLEKHRLQILEMEEDLYQTQLSLEEKLAEAYGKRPELCSHVTQHEGLVSDATNRYQLYREDASPWPLAIHALQKLQRSVVNPCFLHGLTAQGWVNLSCHFLADFDQIRLEGEDTSDAINWILREAQQLGQVIEIVLHPLNPDEVIGIVFPERNLAIWQGDPNKLTDQGLSPVLGEKLIETLTHWQQQRSQLKSIYMDSVDFAQIDQLREDLLNEILRELEEL